jgi:hypothetical protein
VSGQIVGEVFAAAEAGLLDDLKPEEFTTLLAIAEKAVTHTRQGQVRKDRIRAAVRAGSARRSDSDRTAYRVIRSLKERRLAWVVRRGHKPRGKDAEAPLYEVATFPVAKASATSSEGKSSTEASANYAEASANYAEASAKRNSLTSGSVSYDGNDGNDGWGLRKSGTSPGQPLPSRNAPPPPGRNGQNPDSRCRWCQDTGIVLDRFGRVGIRPRICSHYSGDRPRFRYATRDEAFGEFADVLTKLGYTPRPEMFSTDGSARVRRTSPRRRGGGWR